MRGPTLAFLALALLALALTAGCAVTPKSPTPAPQAPQAPRLALAPAGFADLPDWGGDDPGRALTAFRATCRQWARRDAAEALAPEAAYGTLADWREPCAAALAASISDARGARAFFETWFTPWALRDAGGAAGGEAGGEAPARAATTGLFTGYYEPLVRGARKPRGPYQTPLRARPDDLVSVDLGAFAPDLKGRRTAGKVVDGALRPYPDRAAIAEGALAGRGLEFLWLDDPIDAFFLEIQGSGRVSLDDGSTTRVTYAAQNGHAYTAIGQVMIRQGLMRREDVSLQSLRAWLRDHPESSETILRANRSYVFFREVGIEDPSLGPPGADGVALTPGRSLAVDQTFHGLGAPMFLSLDAQGSEPALSRLMIAQDTGGAIRGVVRGDVFWGFGAEAEARAGAMKRAGRLWVLLPRALSARLGPGS